MNLLRVGADKPAILDHDGAIRDMSGIVQGIAGTTLTPERLARIRATDISMLPGLDAGSRIGEQRQLTKA